MQGCDPPGDHPGLLAAEGGRLQAGPVSVPLVHRQVEGGPPHPESQPAEHVS